MPSRSQYVQELSKQLDEWDSKVEEITGKSNRRQMDSALLDDLLQKQAAAHEWLNEVREADESLWEELKAQASVASQDYQDVLERAAERFKVEGPREASRPSQRQEGGSEATDEGAPQTGGERTGIGSQRRETGSEAEGST